MAKNSQKKDSVLDLPNGTGISKWESTLVPFKLSNQARTRDERKIGEEYRKQTLVIGMQGEKTKFGITKIRDMYEHATTTFDATVDFILTTKAGARSREHQVYLDAFANRGILDFANHTFRALEVGANNIGEEIYRPLYSTLPERGFLSRLFGSD